MSFRSPTPLCTEKTYANVPSKAPVPSHAYRNVVIDAENPREFVIRLKSANSFRHAAYVVNVNIQHETKPEQQAKTS